jgi:hypothetical protein
MQNIIGYIHVCQKYKWQKSFSMLIDCIKKYGLYDNTNEIRLGIVNDNAKLIEDDILNDKKFNIVDIGKSDQYERLTLLNMRKMAEIDNEETVYFYLHTKGISHFDTAKQYNVIDWINLMLYWNIENWKLALKKLETYDTYGCNHTGEHYSGNFWWAKKQHILKLPQIIESYYTAPEDWVQIIRKNSCNIYSSGLQGMGHYRSRFPREKYEIKINE